MISDLSYLQTSDHQQPLVILEKTLILRVNNALNQEFSPRFFGQNDMSTFHDALFKVQEYISDAIILADIFWSS